MKVVLAWHNVWANGRRLAAATAGIGFATLLIFVQLGSIDTVRRTATLVYDAVDFDVVLVSNEYQYLNRAGWIRAAHLAQARVIPGVERVFSMDYRLAAWEDPETGDRTAVMVFGIEPDAALLRHPGLVAGLGSIRLPGRALVDERSSPLLGPLETGRQVRINLHPVTLTGRFTMGMRFYGQGTVVVNPRTYRDLTRTHPEHVTFGFLQLAPGVDPGPVLDRLRQVLPEEVVPFGRDEFLLMEKDRYTTEMPLGILTRFGVAVSLLLGAVVVFQVISTDFSNRLDEYATLKATGFSSAYVFGVGLQQSAVYALLAYAPALAISSGIFHGTTLWTGLPMLLTARIALTVLALSLGMCLVAGIGALNTVHRADPADLF